MTQSKSVYKKTNAIEKQFAKMAADKRLKMDDSEVFCLKLVANKIISLLRTDPIRGSIRSQKSLI